MLLGLIKKTCPWYWEMSALIGERPNVTPVGLGNNQSSYDTSLLLPHGSESDSSEVGFPDVIDDIADDEDLDDHNGDSDANDIKWEQSIVGSPRRVDIDFGDGKDLEKAESEDGVEVKAEKVPKVQASRKKRTEPKPAISKRAELPIKKEKVQKRTPIDRFSDIAMKEEETTQKQLELKKTKVQGQSDEKIAEIQAKAKVKLQRDKLRAEYAQKKLDHEFRMAQMTHFQPQNNFSTSNAFASSSNSQYPSSFGSTSFSSGNDWSEALSAGTSTPGSSTRDLNTDFDFSGSH